MQRIRTLYATTLGQLDGSTSWYNLQRLAGCQDGEVIDYSTVSF